MTSGPYSTALVMHFSYCCNVTVVDLWFAQLVIPLELGEGPYTPSSYCFLVSQSSFVIAYSFLRTYSGSLPVGLAISLQLQILPAESQWSKGRARAMLEGSGTSKVIKSFILPKLAVFQSVFLCHLNQYELNPRRGEKRILKAHPTH